MTPFDRTSTSSPAGLLWFLSRNRRLLLTITRIELEKRYSGSLLGKIWIPLYPVLFLSVYLFVYLVVFRVKFPGYSEVGYVVYVFSGLVPYIAFMDAMQNGAQSVRQNIHLIKNVIMPIELAPARAVMMAGVTFCVGLAIALVLALVNGSLDAHVLLLPAALGLLFLFLYGIAAVMSALGVLFPDTSHFINLVTLLGIFISPIGFKPDMVPPGAAFIVYLNPIHYMMAPFRISLLGTGTAGWWDVAIFAVLSLGVFVFGCYFFGKFKNHLVDYE